LSQVVGCFPNKHDALNSIPSTAHTHKKNADKPKKAFLKRRYINNSQQVYEKAFNITNPYANDRNASQNHDEMLHHSSMSGFIKKIEDNKC
jgi:hypothetical protein